MIGYVDLIGEFPRSLFWKAMAGGQGVAWRWNITLGTDELDSPFGPKCCWIDHATIFRCRGPLKSTSIFSQKPAPDIDLIWLVVWLPFLAFSH